MTVSHSTHDTLKAWVFALVAAHLLVTFAHAAAHIAAPVPSTTGQYIFVTLFIYIAPLVAVWLLMRERREGALLLIVSMGAAFVFGLVNHFIVISPDHISQTPPGIWQPVFAWSAAITTLLQLAAVVVGMMLVRARGVR
jgi:hypothetical protein